MIALLGSISRVAAALQTEAAQTAHASGVTWAQIGRKLNITRQAVQQRFDPSYRPARETPDGRVLGPVSRAEEVEHLNAAGKQGWKPIVSRHGEHVLQQTAETWEVQRVSALAPRKMPSEADGWQAAATRFPDIFYTRVLSNPEHLSIA